MGYTTDFMGTVRIEPPLNEAERDYLWAFSRSRRMRRVEGPYATEGNESGPGIEDVNTPAEGQPQLWCQWVPNADGTALEWDGHEKFYAYSRWMAYLIDTFLKPGCELQDELTDRIAGREYPAGFEQFTFDHCLNGVVDAVGQDGAAWRVTVRDNEVSIEQVRGPAPVDYTVFMWPRRRDYHLDREFDAAFDIYDGEYLRVDDAGAELEASVRAAVVKVRPLAREISVTDGVELVDDSIGLEVGISGKSVRISLLAEGALPVWERAAMAMRGVVVEIAQRSGWIAYDPARRMAVRPSAEFWSRAEPLVEGWVEEQFARYKYGWSDV